MNISQIRAILYDLCRELNQYYFKREGYEENGYEANLTSSFDNKDARFVIYRYNKNKIRMSLFILFFKATNFCGRQSIIIEYIDYYADRYCPNYFDAHLGYNNTITSPYAMDMCLEGSGYKYGIGTIKGYILQANWELEKKMAPSYLPGDKFFREAHVLNFILTYLEDVRHILSFCGVFVKKMFIEENNRLRFIFKFYTGSSTTLAPLDVRYKLDLAISKILRNAI